MSYFFAILLDHPDKPGDDIKVNEKGACRNTNEKNIIDKIGVSAPLNTSTLLRSPQAFRQALDFFRKHQLFSFL